VQLPDKVSFQISVIIVLSISIGILYNHLSRSPLPLIGDEPEDFSQSDSLMLAMMKQDSISRVLATDSLKLLSQRREDSLSRISKLDSLKRVTDSLKSARKRLEDSLKSLEKKSPDTSLTVTAKPVDIKLDFAKLLFDKNYAFIDARDESDYNGGHIQRAVNIPYHKFDEYKSKLNQFSRNQPIVVYCSSGCDVSIDLAYAMVKEGFTKLYIFRGGWDEWKAAGYPAN
jgi:rhodanese-related sulfurtransferase